MALATFMYENLLEAGCDEAGRGCLAGPVYAAAVIWPVDLKHKFLDDSKKLNHKTRMELRSFIMENATAYSIHSCGVEEIDEINILKASFKAMHKAIDSLSPIPDHLLIDGHMFTQYPDIDHSCIVKGDAKYASIAAASILAKTERDLYMISLAEKFPEYQWESNKGYATASHIEAIRQHGFTVHHRKTFHVKSIEQPELF